MKQTFVNTSPPKPFNPSTQIKPSTKKHKSKRGPSTLMKQIEQQSQINLRNVNLKMKDALSGTSRMQLATAEERVVVQETKDFPLK